MLNWYQVNNTSYLCLDIRCWMLIGLVCLFSISLFNRRTSTTKFPMNEWMKEASIVSFFFFFFSFFYCLFFLFVYRNRPLLKKYWHRLDFISLLTRVLIVYLVIWYLILFFSYLSIPHCFSFFFPSKHKFFFLKIL